MNLGVYYTTGTYKGDPIYLTILIDYRGRYTFLKEAGVKIHY